MLLEDMKIENFTWVTTPNHYWHLSMEFIPGDRKKITPNLFSSIKLTKTVKNYKLEMIIVLVEKKELFDPVVP